MNNPDAPHDANTSWGTPPVEKQPTPPIFNLPGIILVLIGSFIAIHAVMNWLLSEEQFTYAFLLLSFIPATITQTFSNVPSEWVAYWTPVTHAFLHGDWLHLGVNAVWLTAFGSVVAKRLGVFWFIVFFMLGSASGALAHYLSHGPATVPVVGASGAVSACMGAAVRFAFTRAGVTRTPELAPRLSLLQSFQNPSIVAFVGIWFAMNWLFGSGVIAIPGAEGGIAWEAHVGGFVFGLLAFGVFDMVRPKAIRR